MAGKSRIRRRSAPAPGHTAAGSVRIIAGALRGRTIEVPEGADLRPTPNRVRETLFNWLRNEIDGARCLDLFAGSGALGIEALSRGAAAATFVEHDARVAAALRRQLERLGVTATVVCAAAEAFICAADSQFDIVFADPPFDLDATSVCQAAERVLGPGGVLYCERDAAEPLPQLKWASWHREQRAGGVRFGLARVPRRD